MEVKMLMSVHVVESKASFLIRTKLSFNLCSQLCSHPRPHAYLKSKPRKVLPQRSACVNEIGQLFRRQGRLAVDEYQVQADPQGWKTASACNCVRCRSGSDHQACGRKNALPVRPLYGCIDFRREA